jgi:hypothetical protein
LLTPEDRRAFVESGYLNVDETRHVGVTRATRKLLAAPALFSKRLRELLTHDTHRDTQ